MSKPLTDSRPYMNVPEASSYMRISERKVRELIATRELKCVRIGRRVFIRRTDIDNFMESLAFCEFNTSKANTIADWTQRTRKTRALSFLVHYESGKNFSSNSMDTYNLGKSS